MSDHSATSDPRRRTSPDERCEGGEAQREEAPIVGLRRLHSDHAEVPTDVEADLKQWRDKTDPERPAT
jgi:hypothetical protein